MRTLTVSEAKPRLGKLVDLALSQKAPVFIRRGALVVQLVPAVMPDPIEVYAPGALSRSASEIARLSLAMTSDKSGPQTPAMGCGKSQD